MSRFVDCFQTGYVGRHCRQTSVGHQRRWSFCILKWRKRKPTKTGSLSVCSRWSGNQIDKRRRHKTIAFCVCMQPVKQWTATGFVLQSKVKLLGTLFAFLNIIVSTLYLIMFLFVFNTENLPKGTGFTINGGGGGGSGGFRPPLKKIRNTLPRP